MPVENSLLVLSAPDVKPSNRYGESCLQLLHNKPLNFRCLLWNSCKQSLKNHRHSLMQLYVEGRARVGSRGQLFSDRHLLSRYSNRRLSPASGTTSPRGNPASNSQPPLCFRLGLSKCTSLNFLLYLTRPFLHMPPRNNRISCPVQISNLYRTIPLDPTCGIAANKHSK